MRSHVLITALAAAAAVALVGHSPASGQGPAPAVGDPRVHITPPAVDSRYVSVTVAYNFALPVKPNDVDSQRASMEQGRTMLYEMTAKECEMLLATMASSCQLERLNLQTSVVRNQRPGEDLLNVSANAQFKIQLKPKN